MNTTAQTASAELRKILPPGTTVFTCMRYRSPNGMNRRFTLHVVGGPYGIRDITYHAAYAAGLRFDPKHEAIRVNGCGMDMGFHCVYTLGRALYPDGFDLPAGETGRNGDTSGADTDGGYALRQRHLGASLPGAP